MIKFWQKSLLIQIVGSFSLLSMAIVGLVGGVAFIQARESLKQSVFDRLTTAAALKEGDLNRWLIDRHDTLRTLNQLSTVKTAAQVILTQDKSSPDYQGAQDSLQTLLSDFKRGRTDYREFFVLS